MRSGNAITPRDRTLLLGVFPSVLGIITYVLLSGAVASSRLLMVLAAFAVARLLGEIAVRVFRNERRAAYLLGLGISLTITVGGVFVLGILTIMALGQGR